MLSMPCVSPTSNTTGLSSWLCAETAVKPATRATTSIAPTNVLLVLTRVPPLLRRSADYLKRSHQMPVEEPLEALVVVHLRPRPKEAVGLRRVSDEFKGFMKPAELLHELLRLLRAHPFVALAVRDQQRHSHVLEAVVGRARAVGLARRR